MCGICASLRPYQNNCDYEGFDFSVPFSIATISFGDSAVVNETTDAPWSTGTPYTIGVGDTFNGTLSSNTDGDIINLTVVAGETYTIDLAAASGSSVDTYLRIFTSSGQYVTTDDDGGTGSNSRLTLTFATSGTYLIAA